LNLKIIFFVALFAITYIIVFSLPDSTANLSLSPEKVNIGEWWRFLSYPFAHLNIVHLVENIAGFAIAGLLAIELKSLFRDFSSTYIISGFFAILPVWAFLHFTALGASSAIFGAYGLISLETKKYNISPLYIIPVFIFVAFAEAFVSYFSNGMSQATVLKTEQALSHISGFIFGILFFSLMIKLRPFLDRKRLHVLRSGG